MNGLNWQVKDFLRKNILTTLSALIIFLAAFLGGYVLSSQKDDSSAGGYYGGNLLEKFISGNKNGKMDDSANQPPSESEITAVSGGPVLPGIAFFENNSTAVFYEQGSGRLIAADLSTKEARPLSAQIPADLINILWPAGPAGSRPVNGEEIIGEFHLRAKEGTAFKYFNFPGGKISVLPGVKSAVFSPSGRQIASFQSGLSGDSNKITVSSPDGGVSKNILNTRLDNFKLYWPQENLLFLKISDNFGFAKLFSLNKDGAVTEVLRDKKDLEIKWSPAGNLLMFSVLSADKKAELFYKALPDGEEKRLAGDAPASKCAWGVDSAHIFCVESIADGSETIFRLNIAENEKQPVSLLGSNIKTKEFLISNLEDYAIILNAYDQRVYSVKLTEKRR